MSCRTWRSRARTTTRRTSTDRRSARGLRRLHRRDRLLRVRRARRGRARHERLLLRRVVDELPVRVLLGALERLVAQVEAGGLHRLHVGEAVDAHDPAVGRLDDAPLGAAGHRVEIEAAQVALDVRLARILQQILERARILPRSGEIVALDRAPVLAARVQELRLLVAQRRGVPDLAGDREPDADEGDGEEDRQIGKARLPVILSAAKNLLFAGAEQQILRFAQDDGSSHRHHSANALPSLAWPGAPLFTSYMPPFCGSWGGTTTQVSFFSVIGSTGTLRRYFSETSASRFSGYLPRSP